MANCVNCGKKIGMFNGCSDWTVYWGRNDKTMCQSCTDPFKSLLENNKFEWKDAGITREFILQNEEALHLQKAGMDFLLEYADYVQSVNPVQVEIAAQKRKEEEEKEKERLRKQMEEDLVRQQEVNRELAKILISSGFNFEGYRIVKYSGYISGDDAVQIPRSGVFDRGRNGENLTDALVRIRRVALQELKQAAYDLGCNAVIGVDFDYITLEPQTATIGGGTLYEPYVICVTANGNAVVIEKIED